MDRFLTHFLDMSLVGSAVILVVLFARLVMGRMPKIFSYCLWAVVLLRLLCPAGISLPIPSAPALPSFSEQYTLTEVEVPLPAAGKAAIDGLIYATNADPDTFMVQIPQPSLPDAVVTCSPWETWVLWGQYIWVCGAITVAAISLWRYLQLRRRIREAVQLEGNVFLVDGIAAPFVSGLLRPRIYLPSDLQEEEQTYIILHERHHIRRLDPLWKLLGFGALCLHWFNPLVWLAFALATQDMEMSCDEAVAKQLSAESRADYAQSLLRFSAGSLSNLTPAFSQNCISKRIRNLGRWKQPKRALSLLTALFCLLLTVGCALDPVNVSTTTQPQSDSIQDQGVQLLFDIEDDSFDGTTDEYFQLPEFPNLQFIRSGGGIYILRGDQWDRLLHGHQLYIADLNGDGKREFLATMASGSGIIDYRIYVYDVADDMLYCMQQRMVNDFDMTIENGKLVVQRRAYKGKPYHDPTVDKGTLRIENRRLYYISGDQKVPGVVESIRFDPDFLRQAASGIQDYISRGMYFTVYYNDATNYYLDRHMDAIHPAMLEQEESHFWLDSALMQDKDVLQYLELLCRVTYPYHVYGLPDRYVYLDPENPAQLFICTELRDTGFDDIRAYYEALVAGNCQPHPDTYVMRLDEQAICRWGESENLYDALRIS